MYPGPVVEKPPIFTWYDALTFGLFAIIATVIVAVALFNGLNTDVAWWRKVGTVLIVGMFWGGYALVLWWRKRLRDRILYVTKHGLMILGDGGTVPYRTQVESFTASVLHDWNNALQLYPKPIATTAHDALAAGVMVFIKPLPFELHTEPGRFAGFAKPWRNAIAIGLDQASKLERSALGHELGHIILHHAIGDGSEDKLKEFAAHYGVPY